MTSTFELYLRTGRKIAARKSLETKFNPWHDPADGRFTFAQQGQYFPGATRAQRRDTNARARGRGFGGGGGSFGGGGAGGSWNENLRSTRSPSREGRGSATGGGFTGMWSPSQDRRSSPARARASTAGSPRDGARRENVTPHDPRLTVHKNGYDFSIDAHARTRVVSGEIRLNLQPRSRSAQSDAGKPDRRTTDDGGHFIAARFNGPREWFNHFAQDANFNRGAYRAVEDTWAKAVRSGRRVFVEIMPHYRGTSMRPYKLDIIWFIDGNRLFRALPNEKQDR